MSKGLKVTIQTKPYLKKYLHTLYGNPLRFTSDNEFGMTIAAFLHRPVSRLVSTKKGKEALRMRFDKYDTSVELYLPNAFRSERRGDYQIEDENVIIVNKLFERKFVDDIWSKCNLMSILGVEIREALTLLMDTYNIVIDEDISMDSLEKKEYRHRKKMQILVPQLSAESVKINIKKIILNSHRTGKRHG